MRTVFTIDLPKKVDGYASDEVITGLIDDFGWYLKGLEQLTRDDIRAMMGTQRVLRSPGEGQASGVLANTGGSTPLEHGVDLSDSRDNVAAQQEENVSSRTRNFRRLSEELFRDMPEVAAAERQSVIYMGYLQSDQVLFVITRMVPAQVTFRLLHRELPRLQSATEKMMKQVVSARLNAEQVYVGNPLVYVFERGHDHVILTGRVITQPILETFRSNLKDALFFTVPLILFIPTAIAAIYFPLPVIPPATAPSTSALFWKGSLDRLTTVEITTALVSALGLLQTFVGIRRSKIIDWGFAKRKE